MKRICVAVLLFCVFNLRKSERCNRDIMYYMPGCDVSFNWTLGNKPSNTIYGYVSHSSRQIAHLSDNECIVMDNSSASCSTSNHSDEWILSLTIFNITEQNSGNYTIIWNGEDMTKDMSSKELLVIGKPHIRESVKPILNKTFEMACNTPIGPQCSIYRWKINGSEITPVSNENVHYVSSLRMTDKFSQVTCQVCLNKAPSDISSELCKHDGCSADSDPYSIDVMYGPENVSLSLKEHHFYLREHDLFRIDCLADCNPKCTFWWTGQATIDSEKLEIANFGFRMAGQYTCHVTNQKINITSKSDTIILHHVEREKDKSAEGKMGYVYTAIIGMGLLGFAVLLAVIGVLLVIGRRKIASNKTGPRILNQPVVNLHVPTNGEMLQGISRIQSRPLPVPSTHQNTSERPYRLMYRNHNRKSRSLHNLLDSAQDSFYPLRGDVSLQLLYSRSDMMGRSHTNGTHECDTIKKRCFPKCEETQFVDLSGLENCVKLDVLRAKVNKVKAIYTDEHNADSFKEVPQEDLYSTIKEDGLSIYDDSKGNSTN